MYNIIQMAHVCECDIQICCPEVEMSIRERSSSVTFQTRDNISDNISVTRTTVRHLSRTHTHAHTHIYMSHTLMTLCVYCMFSVENLKCSESHERLQTNTLVARVHRIAFWYPTGIGYAGQRKTAGYPSNGTATGYPVHP